MPVGVHCIARFGTARCHLFAQLLCRLSRCDGMLRFNMVHDSPIVSERPVAVRLGVPSAPHNGEEP